MWQWWLGIPSMKNRMMHLVWANWSKSERAQSWGNDLVSGERRKWMWGGPHWIHSLLSWYCWVLVIYLRRLVSCQGLIWLALEGHVKANEVQSIPGSFVLLQLKRWSNDSQSRSRVYCPWILFGSSNYFKIRIITFFPHIGEIVWFWSTYILYDAAHWKVCCWWA